MNLTDRTFSRLVLGAMTIGFAALIAAGAMAIWTVARNQDHARLIEHAYQVNATIGRYQIQLERAETARRGYLLDQSALFEREYAAATRAAAEALDGLKTLIRDPQQHLRYDRLRALTRVEVAAMGVSMGLRNRATSTAPRRSSTTSRSVSALLGIRALSEQMTTAQDALQVQRGIDQRASLLCSTSCSPGPGCCCCWSRSVSGWAIRRYTGSLAASRDALARCQRQPRKRGRRAHRRPEPRQRRNSALRLYRQPRPALAAGQHHGLHRRARSAPTKPLGRA